MSSHFSSRTLVGVRAATLAVSTVALLGGCSKNAQAPPPGQREPNAALTEDPYYCVETAQALSNSDLTPFGYSVQSLLDRLGRTQTTTLSWQQSEQTYGPEQGQSVLTLSAQSITATEFIDRSMAAREGWVVPDDITEESLGCRDVVRLQAMLSVTSDGGALAEQQQVTFEAGASGIPTGTLSVPLTALGGTFTAQLQLPAGRQAAGSPSLEVNFGVFDAATAGDVWLNSGALVGSDATSTQGIRTRIAHFPPGNTCGEEYDSIGVEQLLRRVAMAHALMQLNAMSPTAVSGEAAAADAMLSLFFSNTDDTVCNDTLAKVESALLFPATVILSSDDGKLDGAVTLDVVSLAADSRITASRSRLSDDPTLLSTLPAEFGIAESIDLEGYAGSSVELEVGVTPTGPFGTLRAFGLGATDCGASAGADAGGPDGGRQIGCSSEGRTLLWGLRWGQTSDSL